MRKRGVSEKLQYILNPLPKVSERELVEKTDLDLLNASDRNFFEWGWKYSSGLEMEFVRVQPQEMLALRASETREFLKEFREMGAVAIDDPADEDAVKKATIQGLTAAHKYWNDRGTKRIAEFRKRQGIGKDDLEDYKYDLWAYYRNQAAADAVKAEIDRLRKPASRSTTKE